MLKQMMKKLGAKEKSHAPSYAYQAALYTHAGPVWMRRDYTKFAEEAYIRNVIAYRSVQMIAAGASSVAWKLFDRRQTPAKPLPRHPLLNLFKRPNPRQGGSEFVEALVCNRLISGNAYVQRIGPDGEPPRELHLLRPDRVMVLAGKRGLPIGYRYQVGEHYTDFPLDRLTGQSEILHLKTFHPLDDWYGLSPIEAAAYSIDQHNQAGAWNQALLQHGARPSGALMVKADSGKYLSEEQFHRLKTQIEDQFTGAANAGRPMLLEGGLEWKEMSLSPKDMDFLNTKHASARDIALAFGVPPQLLGIPGDNTYSNLAEARLALWEQTILPLLDTLADAFNNWLAPLYGAGLELAYDDDTISALAPRRQQAWDRVKDAAFLTDAEKREMVGV